MIVSCTTKGVSGEEHLRRLGQKETKRDESLTLQLGEETKPYTTEILSAGKRTTTTCYKKVNTELILFSQVCFLECELA